MFTTKGTLGDFEFEIVETEDGMCHFKFIDTEVDKGAVHTVQVSELVASLISATFDHHEKQKRKAAKR